MDTFLTPADVAALRAENESLQGQLDRLTDAFVVLRLRQSPEKSRQAIFDEVRRIRSGALRVALTKYTR